MTESQSAESLCTCGYQAEGPDDLAMHFGELFIPPDDVAPDGQVHTEDERDEKTPPWTTFPCRCGFTATSRDAIDQHLINVFTPPDRIGLDGNRHAPAS
jgi:hypothetical protein